MIRVDRVAQQCAPFGIADRQRGMMVRAQPDLGGSAWRLSELQAAESLPPGPVHVLRPASRRRRPAQFCLPTRLSCAARLINLLHSKSIPGDAQPVGGVTAN